MAIRFTVETDLAKQATSHLRPETSGYDPHAPRRLTIPQYGQERLSCAPGHLQPGIQHLSRFSSPLKSHVS
jgi:hypothetical protein